MYNFRDISTTSAKDSFTPSDNMMLNGKGLNELVQGYRQLSVSGRGIISRRLDLTEVPARSGGWYGGSVDETREITVSYYLEAPSSSELRSRFERLNEVLREVGSNGYLALSFADEPEYTYYGVLQGAEDFEENHLSLVSEFTILCPEPKKQGPIKSSTGSISLTNTSKVLPRKITLTVSGTVDTVEVINGTKKLVLKGSYKAGDVITFDFKPDDFEIFLGSRLILLDLQLYSPLEDFWLRNGDTVTAKNATVTRIEWRDERL